MAETTETSDKGKGPSGDGKAKGGGLMGLLVAFGGVTVLALGAGLGLGSWTAGQIGAAQAEQQITLEADATESTSNYGGEIGITAVEAVVTNLASPSNVWVRLESAIIYHRDEVENPDHTAGEIRQDILAYLRTLHLAQLESPSALQHLREDLNERVKLRTRDKVDELVIQALIVQ